jgi:hypothetical protein
VKWAIDILFADMLTELTLYPASTTKAAAGRQSLRRRQPAQMAQTKEGQSSRSIQSLTPDALSSGQQGLQTQKSHRTNVLQAQELATHRNPI